MAQTSAPDAPAARCPRDLAGWVASFDPSRLPVLAETAQTLESARANEDAVDAHLLGETIAADPLMTLKLMAHLGHLRRGREGGEPETVTAALVMLGIPPFFRHFGPQASIDEALAGRPWVLEGFRAVLQRSHRAAHFATAFAVQRLDHDVAVIHSAALLHDFAELLLWIQWPALAMELARRQRADPSLRSLDVQNELLGVSLAELQHALMVRWRLPRVLAQLADDSQQNASAQVRNVLLAVRLARHTARGWDNPAVPDDVRDIAGLLHLGVEPTETLLREIDG
ncbi:MAG: HDOD domain-containing protein [Rubrivivax sp.]|nr:HDOD domain-containing protein [Rubrivivax sp.]